MIGQVITPIDLKFIVGKNKKHKTIVDFTIKVERNQKINVIAYDEMADKLYRCAKRNITDICIEGKLLKNGIVKIEKFYVL